MIKPELIDKYADELLEIYTKAEANIYSILGSNFNKYEKIREEEDYLVKLLMMNNKNASEIKKELEKTTALSQSKINHIFNEIDNIETLYYNKLFQESYNIERQKQIIKAQIEILDKNFGRLTQTTGFIDKNNNFVYNNDVFYKTLSQAELEVQLGIKDYESAIRDTKKQLTNKGIKAIDYASGIKRSIESVVRTNILSGINSITKNISLENANLLDTNKFEVSAHFGSRPSHAEWQGGIYSKEELSSVCGLDAIDGLQGANCGHTFYPFVEELSEKAYSKEELREIKKTDKKEVEFNEKKYNLYEYKQKQKQMENNLKRLRNQNKIGLDVKEKIKMQRNILTKFNKKGNEVYGNIIKI